VADDRRFGRGQLRPKRLLCKFIAEVGVGFAASFGAAALVTWSFWWPHRDNRQNLSTFAAVLLACVGLAALGASLRTAGVERRRAVAALMALALLLGATAGYAILRAATQGSL
jgi:hypothetical protein